MKKLSTVIADDDPQGLRVLKKLIAEHDSLELVGEACDGEKAAQLLGSKKPDVVFLDIHMPEANGFEVLRKTKIHPKVVFVTASLTHALNAIDIDAIDYLVKPLTHERFAAAVRRLEHIFELEGALAERLQRTDRLCLRGDDKLRFVPLTRLLTFQAEGDSTRVRGTDGTTVLVCQTLKHYDETLPEPTFLRLDRSLIVNLDHFMRLDRVTRGSSKLWLRGLNNPLIIGRTATERLTRHPQKDG